MKVVLLSINAKYIHTNNAVRLLQANSDFEMTLLEYTIKDDIKQILADLTNYSPDIIACSVYIWNVELFQSIHTQSNLDAIWILGGPEVSYDPTFFLQNWSVDYIVSGEGEIAFNTLLHHIHGDVPLSLVPNVSYKKHGNVIHHPIKMIQDVSTIKSPHTRKDDILHIPHKISYIESSRGCPYNCSYCLSSLEKGVRFFPLETTLDTIQYLMDHNSKTIKFLDRTFNANKHTLSILDYIITHDNSDITVQFEITGDILDETIIDYIHQHARKGLFRFEIGIQSIHEPVNQLVNRHQDTKKLFHIIKTIQENNIIQLHLDLIAGLPTETLPMFQETFDQVFFLGASELQLGFLKMLRGTKIRQEADTYGYIYQENAPYEIMENDALSKEDIFTIHLVEKMLDIYHNRGLFGKHMKQYLLSVESPFQFFIDIALYYQKHNYSMTRYQVDEVYQHLFDYLDDPSIEYSILHDYLSRFPIKPKVFWKQTPTKEKRHSILHEISTTYHIPLHMLFKHSILITYKDQYTVAYYQNQTCTLLQKR